jgi:hypothetical protein
MQAQRQRPPGKRSGRTNARFAELQDRNKRLQALVVSLCKIVLSGTGDPAAPARELDRRDAAELNAAKRWLEAVPALREAALQCAHLARDSIEPAAARELEEISIELADWAATLERIATVDGD